MLAIGDLMREVGGKPAVPFESPRFSATAVLQGV
jgi:hypothetical protein